METAGPRTRQAGACWLWSGMHSKNDTQGAWEERKKTKRLATYFLGKFSAICLLDIVWGEKKKIKQSSLPGECAKRHYPTPSHPSIPRPSHLRHLSHVH